MNLKLRKIEPSDLPFLYQWENDATMWADSDTHNPLSRHDLHQYIENTTGDIYRDGQLRLIIEDSQPSTLVQRSRSFERMRDKNSQLSYSEADRSSECEIRTPNSQLSTFNPQLSTLNFQLSTKVIGCIDLFDFDARNRKAAIGMYIAPHARGNGVGKQAVQLLLDYAFGHLQLRMLYAIISVHNTPCSHIYEQMGFTASSVLQDWTLEGDAILWQKLNK